MRILPIGDGVVLGEGASGGFRTPLEGLLLRAKLDFEFVGRRTENSFRMRFPNHEGWARASIAYIRDECLLPALEFNPDVVLLYVGAEDLRSIPDAGIACARYEKLIKAILEVHPACTVLCSQLITNRDYRAEQKVKKFNTGLGTVIEKLTKKKAPVARIKMHSTVKDEGINDMGMPNANGYDDMALAWFNAIQEISRRLVESPTVDSAAVQAKKTKPG